MAIVGANARLELRRWGAEFLAEAPTLARRQKEDSAVGVPQILEDLLEKPGEDLLEKSGEDAKNQPPKTEKQEKPKKEQMRQLR